MQNFGISWSNIISDTDVKAIIFVLGFLAITFIICGIILVLCYIVYNYKMVKKIRKIRKKQFILPILFNVLSPLLLSVLVFVVSFYSMAYLFFKSEYIVIKVLSIVLFYCLFKLSTIIPKYSQDFNEDTLFKLDFKNITLIDKSK